MNFEIEMPYADDTVYLAYSQPYPYSKIIAHMFDIEHQLSDTPGLKRESLEQQLKSPIKPHEPNYFTKKITKN